MSWLRRLPWRELIKYGVVGSLGVLVFGLVLPVVRHYVTSNGFWAGAMTASIVAMVNYNLKRMWAFQSTVSHRVGVPKYALLVIGNITVDGLATMWLIEKLEWPIWPATLTIAATKPLINFTVLYLWVFGRGPQPRSPTTGQGT